MVDYELYIEVYTSTIYDIQWHSDTDMGTHIYIILMLMTC